MKKIMHTMRKYGVFMAFLLAFTMVFGVVSNVQAEEDDTRDIGQVIDVYDPDEPGSITVTLPDLEGAESKRDVQINLYKVGDLDVDNGYFNFTLTDAFKDVDVDLNDMSDAGDNEATAKKLADKVKEDSIEALKTAWTDEAGKVTFADLEQGMYMVSQGNTNAYGSFSAFVMPVPYANETGWVYDITITPKASLVTTMGRIDVTKMVKGIYDGNLQDVHTENATYYIGLFLDEDGTRPYRGQGGIKAVNIIDGNSATVSFDDVPISDQPYYIFETTQDGEPIQYMDPQGTEDGFYCMAGEVLGAEGHDAAPVIIMENEPDGIGDATISNVYSDLPDGYYYTGDITITKSVRDGNDIIATDYTFYAGIFAQDAQGNVSANPTEIVKLNNNGSVTVEVPLGGTDGTEPITYVVRETNENGVPVSQDSTFPYTVSGEGAVNLSMDQTEATVNIVNSLGTADGYYQEPSTQAPTDPNAGNNNNNNSTDRNSSNRNTSSGTNRSSRSSRTGDDNQILLYGGLLAAAVIVGGVVVARRRRRTNG